MSTLKQIEANRANASKSTGPRTPAGKSVTRLNALQHGLFATDPIIPGEDPAHFEALRSSLYDQFQPANAAEHILLAAMIRDAWSMERASNAESGMLTHYLERHYDDDKPHRVGRAYINYRDSITDVRRLVDAPLRSFRRGLELLTKLQTVRKKLGRDMIGAEPAPASEPIPESIPELVPQPKFLEQLNPEIGFVPPNPQPPSSDPFPRPRFGRKTPLPGPPPKAA